MKTALGSCWTLINLHQKTQSHIPTTQHCSSCGQSSSSLQIPKLSRDVLMCVESKNQSSQRSRTSDWAVKRYVSIFAPREPIARGSETGLGQTLPHFRSQIASEKDMFNRMTIMLTSHIQKLNIILAVRQNTTNESCTDLDHPFLTTSSRQPYNWQPLLHHSFLFTVLKHKLSELMSVSDDDAALWNNHSNFTIRYVTTQL